MMTEDVHTGAIASTAARSVGGHFIHFRSGDNHMLIRIEDVDEVVPVMTLTPVQYLGGTCRGMLNLRGEMIPVFDVMGARQVDEVALSQLILVGRGEGEPLGIVVDDVQDVVVIPDDQVAIRRLGAGRHATFARIKDELLPVLDPNQVLA